MHVYVLCWCMIAKALFLMKRKQYITICDMIYRSNSSLKKKLNIEEIILPNTLKSNIPT